MKTSNYFSGNPYIFLNKKQKSQSFYVLRNVTSSVDSAASLAPLVIYKNFSHFLSQNPKTYLFFWKKKQTLLVLRKLTISSASYSNFGTFSRLGESSRFFRKSTIFSEKLNFLERLGKTDNFSCVLQQNSYL